MTIARPQAILFDWDNTLVDTWPVIHAALEHTFIHMGMEPWDIATTKANVKHSMRDAFPGLFKERWEEAAEVYQNHYQTHHLLNLKPLPAAEELLSHLKQSGIFLGVVSNKRGHNLRKEIRHLGWEHYFQTIVGADDAARDKPSPDPVMLALKDSGITTGEHVWFIGDSVIDLECAGNTGCLPVLYGDVITERGADGKQHYLGLPFRHHVVGHREFLTLLKQAFDLAA